MSAAIEQALESRSKLTITSVDVTGAVVRAGLLYVGDAIMALADIVELAIRSSHS